MIHQNVREFKSDAETVTRIEVAEYTDPRTYETTPQVVISEAREGTDRWNVRVVIPLADALASLDLVREFVKATVPGYDPDVEFMRRMEDAEDARADALSAHWGHD